MNVVLLIRYEEMPPAGLGEQAQELQGKARQEACRKAHKDRDGGARI